MLWADLWARLWRLLESLEGLCKSLDTQTAKATKLLSESGVDKELCGSCCSKWLSSAAYLGKTLEALKASFELIHEQGCAGDCRRREDQEIDAYLDRDASPPSGGAGEVGGVDPTKSVVKIVSEGDELGGVSDDL